MRAANEDATGMRAASMRLPELARALRDRRWRIIVPTLAAFGGASAVLAVVDHEHRAAPPVDTGRHAPQANVPNNSATDAAQELKSSLAQLEAELAEAERRLATLRAAAASRVNVSAPSSIDEAVLVVARNEEAQATRKAQALRAALKSNRVSDFRDIDNDALRRLSDEYVVLRAKIEIESRTYLPLHPRMKKLDAQLASLTNAWRQAAEAAARRLEAQAQSAKAQVESLSQKQAPTREATPIAEGAALRVAEQEVIRLRARLDQARLDQQRLRAQAQAQVQAQARAQQEAAQLAQRAPAPEAQMFPAPAPIILWTTFAAFALSLVAALVSALRGKVTPEAEAVDAPRTSATEPRAEAKTVAPEGIASVEESATQLAADRVDDARATTQCVKALVTPCGGDARLVAAVVALARQLARRGRALLIVFDRDAAAYDALIFGMGESPKGLADLQAGGADFADVIHRDSESRLHVMPRGKGQGQAQYDTPFLIEALSHAYDFLILAAPAGEAHFLAALADLAFVIGADAEAEALRDELALAAPAVYLLDPAAGADDLAA